MCKLVLHTYIMIIFFFTILQGEGQKVYYQDRALLSLACRHFISSTYILANNENINQKLSGYDFRVLSDYLGGLTQSMAIFIAILGLVPLSRGFSLIVGLVLNIEGEFVPYIVGVALVVQNFSEIFCIDFVDLFGSKCILRIYQISTK